MSGEAGGVKRKRQGTDSGPAPWLYLFGTVAWTWIFLAPAIRTGNGFFGSPVILFSVVGLLGPVIISGFLIAVGRWDSSLDPTVGHFLRRCFNPRTLSFRWAWAVVGFAILLAFGPTLADPERLAEEGILAGTPSIFVLIGLLGALEEPGWRGYAQEGLQRQMPVAVAGLVIGVFWAVWHLPLFFVDGTYQAGLGVGTAEFWAFHVAVVVGSPFYAWLYNAAGGIAFAAVLYHGLSNVLRELAADASPFAEVGLEAAMTAAVVALSWRWMRRSVG